MNAGLETLGALGEAALGYARRGWHVFPLAAGTKKPTKDSKGFKDATRDETKIRMWWRNLPNANIGIACGASGLVVLDPDRHDVDGFVALAEHERLHGTLPETPVSLTANNGEHRYYAALDFVPLKNSDAGKLALPGIDLRGTDGYVVAPPSIVEGKVYRWLDNAATTPAPFPLQLSAIIFGLEAVSRNVYLAKVVAPRLRNQGKSGDELMAALTLANEGLADPLDRAELRVIAASADRNYDAARPELAITDTSNGQRLFREFGEDVRWVWQMHSFMHWDGHRWTIDKSGTRVVKLAKRALNCIYDEMKAAGISDEARKALSKHAIRSKNRRPLDDAIAMLRSEESAEFKIKVDAADLDADTMLLGVKNGAINLRTGEFRLGTRSDLITMSAGCAFDAAARCPRFEQFLREIFDGDGALIEWMWRHIGYLLTGSCDDQTFLYFWGGGSNGKGVLCSTLVALLGDYAEVMDSAVLTETGRPFANSNTPEVAKLRRKRLVLVPEVPDGVRLNAARIKNLTGGDHITATAKYEAPITFAPSHKFVLYGNGEPTINSEDFGLTRRATMVPFTQTYALGTPQCDPNLTTKLLAELAGILNGAIAGCLAWQQRSTHVGKPGAVTEKTAEWFSNQTTFADFVNDCCVLEDGGWVQRNTLYQAYVAWHKGQPGRPMAPGELKAKLASFGYGIRVDATRRDNGKVLHVVTGVAIRAGWHADSRKGAEQVPPPEGDHEPAPGGPRDY